MLIRLVLLLTRSTSNATRFSVCFFVCLSLFASCLSQNNKVFPEDPYDQLYESIFAVFDSWESFRAIKYREAEGISGLLGTAVNVQAMCFGNMGTTSGTGVCFTRNPNTGEKMLYGEYLINAQGEDVVAGIRTPQPIATLAESLPEAYQELLANVEQLEANFKDMQDIEVDQGQHRGQPSDPPYLSTNDK